jgi:hypothetical protein
MNGGSFRPHLSLLRIQLQRPIKLLNSNIRVPPNKRKSPTIIQRKRHKPTPKPNSTLKLLTRPIKFDRINSLKSPLERLVALTQRLRQHGPRFRPKTLEVREDKVGRGQFASFGAELLRSFCFGEAFEDALDTVCCVGEAELFEDAGCCPV